MSNSKVISVVNPKGGVGKSLLSATTAAVLAELDKSVMLLDSDPQKTSADFSDGPGFDVQAVDIAVIKTALSHYKNTHEVVVLDTQGSKDDQLLPRLDAIIEMSDLILVPVPGSEVDFKGSLPIIRKLVERWESHTEPTGLIVLNRFDSTRKKSLQFRDKLIQAYPQFRISKAVFPSWQTITNNHEDGIPLTRIAKLSVVTSALTNDLLEVLYGD